MGLSTGVLTECLALEGALSLSQPWSRSLVWKCNGPSELPANHHAGKSVWHHQSHFRWERTTLQTAGLFSTGSLVGLFIGSWLAQRMADQRCSERLRSP